MDINVITAALLRCTLVRRIEQNLTKLVESIETSFTAIEIQRHADHVAGTLITGIVFRGAVRVRNCKVVHCHISVLG